MRDLHYFTLQKCDPVSPEAEGGRYIENAVLISLFSDRRFEILPKGERSKRGYWADSLDVSINPLGSKLWLLRTAPLNDDAVDTAIQYAYDALSWLIEEPNIEDINIDGELRKNEIRLTIEVKCSQENFLFDFGLGHGGWNGLH